MSVRAHLIWEAVLFVLVVAVLAVSALGAVLAAVTGLTGLPAWAVSLAGAGAGHGGPFWLRAALPATVALLIGLFASLLLDRAGGARR